MKPGSTWPELELLQGLVGHSPSPLVMVQRGQQLLGLFLLLLLLLLTWHVAQDPATGKGQKQAASQHKSLSMGAHLPADPCGKETRGDSTGLGRLSTEGEPRNLRLPASCHQEAPCSSGQVRVRTHTHTHAYANSRTLTCIHTPTHRHTHGHTHRHTGALPLEPQPRGLGSKRHRVHGCPYQPSLRNKSPSATGPGRWLFTTCWASGPSPKTVLADHHAMPATLVLMVGMWQEVGCRLPPGHQGVLSGRPLASDSGVWSQGSSRAKVHLAKAWGRTRPLQ